MKKVLQRHIYSKMLWVSKERPGGGNYLKMVGIFMIWLPSVSIVIEHIAFRMAVDPGLIGKWFIFWAVGARLCFLGAHLTINTFLGNRPFVRSVAGERFSVKMELGVVSLSLGLVAMLSLVNPGWRPPIAIAGMTLSGISGILHLFTKPDSRRKMMAMLADLILFCILLLYTFFHADLNGYTVGMYSYNTWVRVF